MKGFRLFGSAVALGSWMVLAGAGWAAPADKAAPKALPPDAAALVDGQPITSEEYNIALTRAARQTFYHGQIKDDRLQDLKKRVIDDLILRRLLLKEADRRGIKPDEADVERKIVGYEAQYKDSDEWKQKRAEVLPPLREQMLQNSRLTRLEEAVRNVPTPDDKELTKFYRERIDAFTEPARDRVAVILLGVDPSSNRDQWNAAKAEAQKIREKILGGGNFEEMAKLSSSDESAGRGGDMGYLHRGMLATSAQEAVDKLKIGELTEPVEILQGYGLFKLLDRQPPKVRELNEVRDRAIDLYKRDSSERKWTETKEQVRRRAQVIIHPDLAAPAPQGGADKAK